MTQKRPQIIGTNEMPDFCQMLCFSRKTRKHMQHQTNKRCSRLCGICTKTVTAVPLLSVNRGMNGSVFIWNYIKLKLNIADMEYILHFLINTSTIFIDYGLFNKSCVKIA